MFVTWSRARLAPTDRERFEESARRSVAKATQQPGCIAYRQMVDLFDPETVYVLEVWESEEAFRPHADADYHHQRIRELLDMDFEPQESFRFEVAQWRRGGGVDLAAHLPPGPRPPADES
jgi:quinol monooxygenase YgiN